MTKRPTYLADEVPKMAAELVALRARVASLEAALRDTAHGGDSEGPCWCFYVVLMHPPDDPQDAVKLRDGHTEECWRAKDALAPRSERREGDR